MAKVIVVDDDPDIVEAIEVFLTAEGHEVLSANSRQEGMKLLEGQTPDLAILDCMMEQPDDGMVMAQDLKRSGFAAPIMMLSNINAVTGQDFDRDDEIIPVDMFQTKPVDRATFIEKVNILLAGTK